MGYGDCRNMPLLNNIGMKIHGVEISEEITEVARQKLNQLQIPAELKIGHNTHIPYPDSFFDVVLACSSFYYINQGETFAQNMQEYLRVLKPGGLLIANFPEYYKSFICKDGIDQGNGHIIVTNDVHGLRNGYTLKVYKSKEDIVEEFEHHFTDISIGYLYEEYYEYELSMFIMTAYKK
jgi:ubiquinone/menaquinone biosynthesis C-methylase UbiE